MGEIAREPNFFEKWERFFLGEHHSVMNCSIFAALILIFFLAIVFLLKNWRKRHLEIAKFREELEGIPKSCSSREKSSQRKNNNDSSEQTTKNTSENYNKDFKNRAYNCSRKFAYQIEQDYDSYFCDFSKEWRYSIDVDQLRRENRKNEMLETEEDYI